MDVLDVIKKEHRDIREIAERIKTASVMERPDLFDELYTKLLSHNETEESVIYPRLVEKAGTRELAELVKEESHLTRYQLSLLRRTSVGNDTWNAKFHVLSRLVSLNMQEEEGQFDELVRQNFTGEEMEELTQSYNEKHQELMAKYS